jgi:hypothetical protein
MRKRIQGFIAGFICCALLAASAGAVFGKSATEYIQAAYNNIKIYVDGSLLTPRDGNGSIVEPFIYNGTTYLPVRAVGEAVGKSIGWDGATYSVYIGGAPTPPPVPPASTAPAVSLTAGSTVTWDMPSGQPLEWLVLEVRDGGQALLLTKDVIGQRAYNVRDEKITWENCTLRQWLNQDFYNTFTDAQKNSIAETAVINEDNSKYGTPGGNDTRDKVFLLSIDEAERYFSDDSARTAKLNLTRAQMEDAARRMDENSDYYDLTYDRALELNTQYNGEAVWWWLRSPGSDANRAAIVLVDGYVGDLGGVVITGNGGVRPALWVNL